MQNYYKTKQKWQYKEEKNIYLEKNINFEIINYITKYNVKYVRCNIYIFYTFQLKQKVNYIRKLYYRNG